MNKHSTKLVLVLPLALILLFGCALLPGITLKNDEVARFIGRKESDLIGHYGQPVDVRHSENGEKVLTFEWSYEETIHEPERIYTDSSGHITSYTGPSTYTLNHVERRIFTIDKNGKVIKGTWKSY